MTDQIPVYDLEEEYLKNKAINKGDTGELVATLGMNADAAPAGTFRDGMAKIIDISQYQQVMKWENAKKYFSGVIIRAGLGSDVKGHGGAVDPLFSQHVQGAYDIGMPAEAYFVIDVGYYMYKLGSFGKLQDIDKQLPWNKDEMFMTLVHALSYNNDPSGPHKAVKGIAIDLELYKDWNGNTLTDGWIMEGVFQFLVRVKKHYPDLVLRLYTGSWFIWNYCRLIESTNRIKGLAKIWTAYYPYPAGNVQINCADVINHMPPENMSIKFPDGMRVTQNPPSFYDDTWNKWQYSGDKFQIADLCTDKLGRPSAMDLNLHNGSPASYYKEIGWVTPEPPPVDPPTPPTPDTDLVKRIAALENQVMELKNGQDAINAKLSKVREDLG